MTVRLNPYLSFRDSARAAMQFYHSIFGGELTMTTFGEAHMVPDDAPPAQRERIMHAQLTTDTGFALMASDTPDGLDCTPGTNFALTLNGDDEELLRTQWDALVVDGRIDEHLAQAPWGDLFGMCTDRFGIAWMVNISTG